MCVHVSNVCVHVSNVCVHVSNVCVHVSNVCVHISNVCVYMYSVCVCICMHVLSNKLIRGFQGCKYVTVAMHTRFNLYQVLSM